MTFAKIRCYLAFTATLTACFVASSASAAMLATNDFETSIFALYPEVARIKQQLYALGALYAAMSGSGSSVFGIFDFEPELHFDGCYTDVIKL